MNSILVYELTPSLALCGLLGTGGGIAVMVGTNAERFTRLQRCSDAEGLCLPTSVSLSLCFVTNRRESLRMNIVIFRHHVPFKILFAMAQSKRLFDLNVPFCCVLTLYI